MFEKKEKPGFSGEKKPLGAELHETKNFCPHMASRPQSTPGHIGGKHMMSREGIDKIIGHLHDP